MQKYLTTSQKDKLRMYLLKRDGNKCFYCKDPFVSSPESKELRLNIDHLDNNAKHNDESNLVLCHAKCNQLKKAYPDYQIMAEAKIQELRSFVDPLRESEATPPKPASKEIDLNVALKKLTWEYLNDRLIRQGKPALSYNDTAHSISFIMWERTGHGSSETVKRHLNDFCSTAGPFKAVEQDGETIILKRT